MTLETRPDLSTEAACRETRPDLSIAAIEHRRIMHDITVERLLATARVHRMTWSAAKRGGATRVGTLRRLATALEMLITHAPAQRPPAVLAAFIRVAQAELGKRLARNKVLRRALCGHARAVTPGRLRRLAIYVVAVELQVENAELARALACSRQNIKQARDAVEDWREAASIDRLLEDVRTLVRGDEP